MQLESYKIIFITIALIGVLLFASPTIGLLISSPTGEKISELYILGSNNLMNNISAQIKIGSTYSVYVGVGNHLGSSSYYTYYVKLTNTTDDLPSTLKAPSSLPILFESNVFLEDEKSIENLLTFKINNASFLNGRGIINSMNINDQEVAINSEVNWNHSLKGYYYYMFVELWKFNGEITEFHDRSVYFRFNVTQ